MECERSRDKSAAGGPSLELGSHLRAGNMRLLGKEGLEKFKEGDEEVNVSGRSGNSFMTF